MLKSNRPTLQLVISVAGVFAALLCVFLFNNYLLMILSLEVRMLLMPVSQWLLFLVPCIMMILNKEKLYDFGFTKKNLLKQIVIGCAIALAMSAVLTVFPILIGLKNMVGSSNYTAAWQFAYQFLYTTLGVALAEELIFRGYIFHKLLEINNKRWFAILISSSLFGLFHIFSGNLIQLFMTAIIGAFYCICREKIKDCTILSLILAHGIYDALIVLWVSIL